MQDPVKIGRYQLHSLLGRGGSGEVWSATLCGPRGFERPVAIKRVRRGYADGEGLVREARLGATLAHPNIVAIHDLVDHGEEWVVVMERVYGPNLATLLRSGPLTPAAVLDVGLQVCAALAVIHAAGMVHRDIKPANLIVDRSGLVKVADLGLTLLVGTPNTPAGTPGYVAPEQLDGRPEPRSDLFALAASLVWMATGQRAFGTGAAALEAVRRAEQVLEAREVLAAVDLAIPGLGPVLGACLHADPRQRPAGALALADDLMALADRHGRTSLAPYALDPARLPAPSVPHSGNLPSVLDTFVGRSVELAELTERLTSSAGLFTLLGPGGAGKTRLALQVGHHLALEGGAWFCDLSEAVTEEGMLHLLGRSLGVALRDGAAEQLGAVLERKGECLVVLDNLEQVVGPAGSLVEAWLRAAPRTRFLATSRIALRLRSERVTPLGPLGDEDAVALFMGRAAHPPGPEDAERVLELVRALDGLPLAIELAAARTRLMGVQTLLDRLGERFRLLADPSGVRPARHRSLRASIDASWDLLSAWEQQALSQLSVFAGGFTLRAAEAVIELPGDAPWTVDVLDALVVQSLVAVSGRRFHLLASIGRYADERLQGTDRQATIARHGRFFRDIALRIAPLALRGPERRRVEELAWELENLAAAARRAAAIGDGDTAAACSVVAAELVQIYGPFPLGEELLQIALPVAAPHGRAELLLQRSMIHWLAGRFDASFEDAREVLEHSTEPALRARAMRALARAEVTSGSLEPGLELLRQGLAEVSPASHVAGQLFLDLAQYLRDAGRLHEARESVERSISIFEAVADVGAEANAWRCLASIDLYQARWAQCREGLDRCIAMFEAAADREQTTGARSILAYTRAADGDLDGARTLLVEAVAEIAAVGQLVTSQHIQVNLAQVCADQGDFEQALALARESVAFFDGAGVRSHAPWARGILGSVLFHSGDLEGGEALLREGLEGCAVQGQRQETALFSLALSELAQATGEVEEGLAHAERALDLAMGPLVPTVHAQRVWMLLAAGRTGEAEAAWESSPPPGEYVPSIGDVSCIDAVMHHRAGRAAEAAASLAAAEAVADRMRVGPGGQLRKRIARTRQVLQPGVETS